MGFTIPSLTLTINSNSSQNPSFLSLQSLLISFLSSPQRPSAPTESSILTLQTMIHLKPLKTPLMASPSSSKSTDKLPELESVRKTTSRLTSPTYLSVIADVQNPPIKATDLQEDDFFAEIDKAVAMKRDEFVTKGLIEPKKDKNDAAASVLQGVEELEAEEVVDFEEIDELQGLRVVSEDEEDSDFDERKSSKSDLNLDGSSDKYKDAGNGLMLDSSFDLDFESFGKSKTRIVEPKLREHS